MKIALLNLPFDNNFGGNLQRYALMFVLQSMGHDVTHIYLRLHYKLSWYKLFKELPLRIIRKYILGQNIEVFWEWKYNSLDNELADTALPFYERYIKHTDQIIDKQGLKTVCTDNYEAYIVGSDQVWREDMTRQIGIDNYFLSFLEKKQHVKRIAYAVSLGNEKCSFPQNKIQKLTRLYRKFDAVSYREESAKRIFDDLGWIQPSPSLVLDPTLLLNAHDYEKLIAENDTRTLTKGKGYCYILDQSKYVLDTIDILSSKMSKSVVLDGINNVKSATSIPQWLKNIHDSDFIITDSFHGIVFSIIFHKPFVFLGNERRGNARIESLFSILNICSDGFTPVVCNDNVYKRIESMKNKSILFLRNTLYYENTISI